MVARGAAAARRDGRRPVTCRRWLWLGASRRARGARVALAEAHFVAKGIAPVAVALNMAPLSGTNPSRQPVPSAFLSRVSLRPGHP